MRLGSRIRPPRQSLYIDIYIYICISILYPYLHISLSIYIYISAYIYMYTYVCIYKYIYTHIYVVSFHVLQQATLQTWPLTQLPRDSALLGLELILQGILMKTMAHSVSEQDSRATVRASRITNTTAPIWPDYHMPHIYPTSHKDTGI